MADKTIAKLLISLEAELKGFKKNLAGGQEAVNKFSSGVKSSIDKMKSHWLGLTAATAGVVLAFRQSFNTWGGFSQRMAEVNTLLGLQQGEFKRLKQSILEMTSVVPQSADELGAAQYNIVSAGIQDTAESLKVLKLSAQAAVAGVTDTNTAAKTGLAVMNAYGMGVSDLVDIYDILFSTVKEGVTTFPELAANIGSVLPYAKAANVSFEDLSASLAVITKSGINTAEATTALGRGIQSLAAPKSKQAAKEMEKLNIVWADGFIPNLEKISKYLDGFAKEDRLKAIQNLIPEERAARAIITLATNMDTLNKTMDNFADRSGAMSAAYREMEKTPENKMKIFSNSINQLVNRVMEFAGTSFVEEIEKMTNSIENFIKSGAAEKLGKSIAAIVKVIFNMINFIVDKWEIVLSLGIAVLVGKISTAIYGLVTAIGALNLAMLTNPFTVWIAGIGTMVALLLKLKNHLDDLKESAKVEVSTIGESIQKDARALDQIYTDVIMSHKQAISQSTDINTTMMALMTAEQKKQADLLEKSLEDNNIKLEKDIVKRKKQLEELSDYIKLDFGKPTEEGKEPTEPTAGAATTTKTGTISGGAMARAAAVLAEFSDRIKTELLKIGDSYKESEKQLQEYFKRREDIIGAQKIYEENLTLAALERLESEKKQAETIEDASERSTKLMEIEADKIKLNTKLKLIEGDAERKLIELTREKARAISELESKQAEIRGIISTAEMRTMPIDTSFGGMQDAETAQMEEKHARELEALQKLTDDKAKIEDLYRAQKIEKDRLMAEQAEELYKYHLKNVGTIAGEWSNILGEFYDMAGKKASAFFYFSKALALAEVAIKTQVAIMKAYEQGGIYGGLYAATIAAQGGMAAGKILGQMIQGFASGGEIKNGTTPTADDVVIRASKGEFMQPASAVDYYGKSFMEAVRRKTLPKSLLSGLNMPSYASTPKYAYQSGGEINTPAVSQSTSNDLQIVNIVDSSMIDRYMSSNAGKRTILNVLADNAYEVKRIVK